jgi:Concanavalin A-like lectin/glucanases superfamily
MDNSIINQGTNDSNRNISFYITLCLLIILIIVTVTVLYRQGKLVKSGNNLNSLKSGDVFIIVLGCLFVAAMFFLYFKFPDIFRNITSVFFNSYYLILLVLYIFFTIILYQNILTPDQVKDYSYIILPITIILGSILFYQNMNKAIGQSASQIKYSIVYFCLILFLSVLYFLNPAGYISQYMGPYLVVSIILTVFGFLYLLTLMSFPTNSNSNSTMGLISNFKFTTILSVILFLLFIIIATIGITTFPGGFFNSSPTTQSTILILIILVCIVWIISFGITLFSNNSEASGGTISEYSKMFRNVLLLLFGLTFSGLLIYWLVSIIHSLSQTSSIVSFLLNLLIILAVLGLTFKILVSTNFYQNSPFARVIVNSLLYIPCFFVLLVDNISYLVGLIKKPTSTSKFDLGLSNNFSSKEDTSVYLIYIGIILLALVAYMFYPYISEKVTNQGGLLLVNQPVYLTEQNDLASYQTLNQIATLDLNNPINPMQFNYNYGLSFWVFLDSTNPSATDQYVSILNYGDKPNIMFNPSENTMIFTVNKTDQLTDKGKQVMYEEKNVILQKWNHIFVQYNGGTFDIFINGKLVKSVNNVVPYKTLDTLQIGAKNGIQGGICNINYFKTLATREKIQNLYNFFKDKTPPVHNFSQDTIMNILEQVPNIVTNKPIQVSTSSNYTDSLNSEKIKNKLKSITKELSNFEYDNSYFGNFLSWDWYFTNNKY